METVLVGCEYNELNKYTPVLNLSSLQNYIWMKIPKSINRFRLYEIYDLSKQAPREVNFFGKIEQDFHHPWIKIPLEILDMKSGKHTYKISFLDERSNRFHIIFISYISQDDNPETPYVYMKNRGNSSHEANTWKDGQYADEYFDALNKAIEADYGYNPEDYSDYSLEEYCAHCTTYDCDNCPHRT